MTVIWRGANSIRSGDAREKRHHPPALPGTGFGPYTATKFAVVGISEPLAMELESQGIGVSILCPGWVATRITESRRNRPKD